MILPKKKAAACRLFVHAIATHKVQGCDLELAELNHSCRTRKIKFLELELELGLANIS